MKFQRPLRLIPLLKIMISNLEPKKGDHISDEEILNLLQNMIKQRKESVKIYSEMEEPI